MLLRCLGRQALRHGRRYQHPKLRVTSSPAQRPRPQGHGSTAPSACSTCDPAFVPGKRDCRHTAGPRSASALHSSTCNPGFFASRSCWNRLHWSPRRRHHLARAGGKPQNSPLARLNRTGPRSTTPLRPVPGRSPTTLPRGGRACRCRYNRSSRTSLAAHPASPLRPWQSLYRAAWSASRPRCMGRPGLAHGLCGLTQRSVRATCIHETAV